MACPEHGDTPYGSYAVLLALFGVEAATAFTHADPGDAPSLQELLVIGLATHKITRIIASDRVTRVVRAPFTDGEDQEPAGDGPRRALGELVTCPYCLGPWVSTGLLTLYRVRPDFTRLIASVFSCVAVSDFTHRLYDALNRAKDVHG